MTVNGNPPIGSTVVTPRPRARSVRLPAADANSASEAAPANVPGARATRAITRTRPVDCARPIKSFARGASASSGASSIRGSAEIVRRDWLSAGAALASVNATMVAIEAQRMIASMWLPRLVFER